MQAHYWYQHLHRLPLVEQLLDGRRDAVHAYLTHIWATWSGDVASRAARSSRRWSTTTRDRAR